MTVKNLSLRFQAQDSIRFEDGSKKPVKGLGIAIYFTIGTKEYGQAVLLRQSQFQELMASGEPLVVNLSFPFEALKGFEPIPVQEIVTKEGEVLLQKRPGLSDPGPAARAPGPRERFGGIMEKVTFRQMHEVLGELVGNASEFEKSLIQTGATANILVYRKFKEALTKAGEVWNSTFGGCDICGMPNCQSSHK